MIANEMADRTRARARAAEYLAKGHPTGWFEPLYGEAERGEGALGNDPPGDMPGPLTRRELNHFPELGLRELWFDDFQDSEKPPVRPFRALYSRLYASVVE